MEEDREEGSGTSWINTDEDASRERYLVGAIE